LPEHPVTVMSHFILTEIQKARRWTVKPGPQFADDPKVLLSIMQHTLMRFHDVELPQQHIDQLYRIFVTEGQQFRQTWHTYFTHDACYA
jgi:hypothetical protein